MMLRVKLSRFRRALAAITLSQVVATGCAAEPSAPPAPPPPVRVAGDQKLSAAAPIEISIIGTNDLHGRIGALPVLGGYLNALRAARPGRVLLVDAGDTFQGTLESNLLEGAPVVDAYRRLGYAAMAIGNHEFDYGPTGPDAVVTRRIRADGESAPEGSDDPRGALKARAAQAAGAFPMLSANIVENGRLLRWPNVAPSVLVRLEAGVTIGVVGVTTIATPKTTISANFVRLAVTPIAEAVAQQARALRHKGADIVVVLAHAGGDCARLDNPDDLSSCKPGEEIFEAARALPPGAVDAIVAGHTHQAVAHRVAGVPIIESYANGKAFGRIDLTWDPAARRVTSARIFPPVELVPGRVYEGAVVEPDAGVQAVIAPAIERAAAKRAKLFRAVVEAPIEEKYKEESALGNLVASLMLELDPEAQIAINNAGNLRADLPAGPLSYGSLYDSLPFDNRLARVMMSGRALADLFRRNLAGQRGILSVAGLRVEARCGPSGLTVNLVLEGKNVAQGRAIKDSDSLRVVTTDYLATGGGDFDVKSILLFEELDEAAPYRERIAEHLRDRNVTLRPSDWLKPGSPRIVFSSGAPACPPGK
jgi:5'-nucleotidase